MIIAPKIEEHGYWLREGVLYPEESEVDLREEGQKSSSLRPRNKEGHDGTGMCLRPAGTGGGVYRRAVGGGGCHRRQVSGQAGCLDPGVGGSPGRDRLSTRGGPAPGGHRPFNPPGPGVWGGHLLLLFHHEASG